MPFGKLQAGCKILFYLKRLSSSQSTIKAWLTVTKKVILWSGSSSSAEDLWRTVGSDLWVLSHLPYQDPSCLVTQFVQIASLGRVLLVPKFYFPINVVAVLLGTAAKSFRNSFAPSPWCTPRQSFITFIFMACFSCPKVHHEMSNQFATCGLQSSSFSNICLSVSLSVQFLRSIYIIISACTGWQ